MFTYASKFKTKADVNPQSMYTAHNYTITERCRLSFPHVACAQDYCKMFSTCQNWIVSFNSNFTSKITALANVIHGYFLPWHSVSDWSWLPLALWTKRRKTLLGNTAIWMLAEAQSLVVLPVKSISFSTINTLIAWFEIICISQSQYWN